MANHVTAEQLEQYRKQTLLPRELLLVDDHLAECSDCSRHFLHDEMAALDLAELRHEAERPQHVSYQEIVAYVEDLAEPGARASVEKHIVTCRRCAQDLFELQQFAARLGTPQLAQAKQERVSLWERIVGFWQVPSLRLAMAGAALTLVVVTGAGILYRQKDGRSNVAKKASHVSPEVAQKGSESPGEFDPEAHGPVPMSSIEGGAPPGQDSALSSRLLGEPQILHDGVNDIFVKGNGEIEGMDDIPALLREEVKQLLAGRPLVLSPSAQWLLGSSSSADEKDVRRIVLISPVATAVETPRPTLRWKPVRGAQSYSIEIYDADDQSIERDESVPNSEWTPKRTLESGKRLVWRVTANSSGAEVATSPEARFLVLPESGVRDLEVGKNRYSGQPLVLGTIYWRYALFDLAEAEFSKVSEQNSGSKLAQKPLELLRGSRNP
jgi:hypothetical protein